MANWNPLTNAVGGAGAANANSYYNTNPTNFGEYGFIYLTEIVDNFIAAYTGNGKILANVLRGDVNFHAHRALQELSYDTLKSCKSQEIEVCPSLKMPLPHDYVNYVKLTSVDNNGIERIIYPTRHTSNPFAISQDDCAYEFNADGTLKHQEDCTAGTETSCDPTSLNNFKNWLYQSGGEPISFPAQPIISDTIYDGTISITNAGEAYNILISKINDICNCYALSTSPTDPSCGACVSTGDIISTVGEENWTTWLAAVNDAIVGDTGYPVSAALLPAILSLGGGCIWGGSINLGDFEFEENLSSWFVQGNFPTSGPFTSETTCVNTSNTSSSYSDGVNTGNSIGTGGGSDPSVDNSNYFQNTGQRYGLQPEHAQINGSFFIDCMRGNIHFDSSLSGETIILKYISDGHGTDDEMMVPKLAEEAMYKWIAYGCAQARTDVDPNTIARLKQERFAETRKAKIRLSNIKLEEISQIMRNKSKWIKH